jgi:hypothetical protein
MHPSVASDDELDEIAQLSDEELEVELTIAAQNPGLDRRYQALLAERERRSQAGEG